MNWWGYAIVCFAIICIVVHWCSSDKKEEVLYNHPIVSEDLSTSDNSENDYDDLRYTEECIEPENPYDEYTQEWHYAGYKWAEETWGGCGGSYSDSFNEWCETYYELEEEYNECINNQ